MIWSVGAKTILQRRFPGIPEIEVSEPAAMKAHKDGKTIMLAARDKNEFIKLASKAIMDNFYNGATLA